MREIETRGKNRARRPENENQTKTRRIITEKSKADYKRERGHSSSNPAQKNENIN